MGSPGAPAAAAAPKVGPVATGALGGRPLTVTILAVLWGVCIPLYLLGALFGLIAGSGVMRFLLPAIYLVMTGVSGVMGWGLWTMKPWSRMAQIVIAALGILTCSFAIASIGTIVYLIRPAAKANFSGSREEDPKEMVFAIVVGVGVLLGAIAGAGLWGAAAFFGNAASSIPAN
jgi:hypothetical protein